jgi:hypothetical protein
MYVPVSLKLSNQGDETEGLEIEGLEGGIG